MPDQETGEQRSDRYAAYLIDALRAASQNLPKFGTGHDVTAEEFRQLYGDDPFYNWLGLDSDLLYMTHRAASSMTSLYRKLGDGCQNLFRAIIRDEFSIRDDQALWEYTVQTDRGPRVRSLDGHIDVLDFPPTPALDRVREEWLPQAKARLGATISPRGVVFEVRQGYKSQDSKRSAGDVDNAGRIALQSLLPAVAVFSKQIPSTVVRKYEGAGFLVLRGIETDDPLESTFAFSEQVMGFDLAGLLSSRSNELRVETEHILSTILST